MSTPSLWWSPSLGCTLAEITRPGGRIPMYAPSREEFDCFLELPTDAVRLVAQPDETDALAELDRLRARVAELEAEHECVQDFHHDRLTGSLTGSPARMWAEQLGDAIAGRYVPEQTALPPAVQAVIDAARVWASDEAGDANTPLLAAVAAYDGDPGVTA